MSLNKVILIGYVGQAPKIHRLANGEDVCNFSIATSESWKDQNGSKTERTEWHNITLYRKLAQIAQQYLKKGSLVCVEGKIQSSKYTDKQGIERTAYHIVCDQMKMLSSKTAPTPITPTPPPPQARPRPAPTAPAGEEVGEIPF